MAPRTDGTYALAWPDGTLPHHTVSADPAWKPNPTDIPVAVWDGGNPDLAYIVTTLHLIGSVSRGKHAA